MADAHLWIGTLIAVLAFATIATVGLAANRIPRPLAIVTAIARAAVQLGALSLVLSGILQDPLWVGVGLAVMFIAAVGTAGRRSRTPLRELGPLALAMLAGPLVVLTIVFVTGAIEFSPRYVLAISGIVIGNAMTFSIVTQRVFHISLIDRWDEVEGWLALGATSRQSTLELGRGAVRTALLPLIDQTRTTGIVVLPGAFVGAIFAGASPLEAGRFQLVVLSSVLAAGVVTGSMLVRAGRTVLQKPEPVPA